MEGVARRHIALLEADPDLAAGLRPEELMEARRALQVPLLHLDVGPWRPPPDTGSSLGVLLLDGVVTTHVLLGDEITSQLAGPGDVVQTVSVPDAALPVIIEHHVSEAGRAAVLERTFIAAVRRWPALLLALHERIRVQEQRMTVYTAIAKLRRAEDRITALLWHLAERWGRVSPEGTVVPMALTHDAIGRLVGARRPTVSLALTELARLGLVTRRADGAFLLAPSSLERLETVATAHPSPGLAVVRTADAPALPEPPAARPHLVDIGSLRARLDALHAAMPERVNTTEAILERSQAAKDRSVATRARIAGDRRTRLVG
jgi:hypothetical protein